MEWLPGSRVSRRRPGAELLGNPKRDGNLLLGWLMKYVSCVCEVCFLFFLDFDVRGLGDFPGRNMVNIWICIICHIHLVLSMSSRYYENCMWRQMSLCCIIPLFSDIQSISKLYYAIPLDPHIPYIYITSIALSYTCHIRVIIS